MSELSSKELVVRQDNRLIESYFTLTVAEMRFIFHLAAKVQPEDTGFTTYSFTAAEVGRMIGDEMLTYAEAEALTMKLWRRELHLASDNGATRLALRWITEAQRTDSTGLIEVALSPKLQPYLLRLAQWTQSRLDLLTTLRSAYAVRLYLMACKVRNQQCPEFELSIAELRARLEIPDDQYTRFVDFNRRILREPIDEINAQGEVMLTYSVEREGRTPISVKFQVSLPPTKSTKDDGQEVAARIKERQRRRTKIQERAATPVQPVAPSPAIQAQFAQLKLELTAKPSARQPR